MTNYKKWLLYTKDLPSPQSYIDFGFYWLISACLQRRVWYYSGDHSLRVNMFVVFVAPPALGKGLVLGRINSLLRHHKYEKGRPVQTNAGPEFPPLFPVSADSITFEELMADIASSMRMWLSPDKHVFKHTSYAFLLEELSSLFKRKTEDVVKFLLNAYDAKEQGYEYKTKHQGKDIIRALCVSFLAGTQFDFLKDAHKSGLFGEGFSSRTIFLFENYKRSSKFHISEETEDQKVAKHDLLAWLKTLSNVYGQLTYGEETYEWLEHWHKTELEEQRSRASERMLHYLGRKPVTLLKLAAAMHFAENLNMVIPLKTFQKAAALLASVEVQMDAGLNFTGRNELYRYTVKILELIRKRPSGLSKSEIVLEMAIDMTLDEIETCLKELGIGHGVKMKIEKGDAVYYI